MKNVARIDGALGDRAVLAVKRALAKHDVVTRSEVETLLDRIGVDAAGKRRST